LKEFWGKEELILFFGLIFCGKGLQTTQKPLLFMRILVHISLGTRLYLHKGRRERLSKALDLERNLLLITIEASSMVLHITVAILLGFLVFTAFDQATKLHAILIL
jgi:hypothetical protein